MTRLKEGQYGSEKTFNQAIHTDERSEQEGSLSGLQQDSENKGKTREPWLCIAIDSLRVLIFEYKYERGSSGLGSRVPTALSFLPSFTVVIILASQLERRSGICIAARERTQCLIR